MTNIETTPKRRRAPKKPMLDRNGEVPYTITLRLPRNMLPALVQIGEALRMETESVPSAHTTLYRLLTMEMGRRGIPMPRIPARDAEQRERSLRTLRVIPGGKEDA